MFWRNLFGVCNSLGLIRILFILFRLNCEWSCIVCSLFGLVPRVNLKLIYYDIIKHDRKKYKDERKSRTSNTYLFRSKKSTPQINNNNFKQCLPILQIFRWQPHPFSSRISILSTGNIVPPARQNARARIININTGTFEFQKHCVPTWRYIRWRLLRNRIWKRKNNSLV